MIKRKEQLITSPFGSRVMDNEEKFHYGVDLRCVDFKTWKDQEVIAPEECKILRIKSQKKHGCSVIVEPLESDVFGYRELKFIHLKNDVLYYHDIGDVLCKGDFIGYCCDYKKGKHLHFETCIEHTKKYNRPINPIEYFNTMDIKFSYK